METTWEFLYALLITLPLLGGAPAQAVIGGPAVAPDEPIARSAVALVGRTTILGNIEVPFFCSGALIHPRVVLTAAHCLVDRRGQKLPLSKLTVSFGLRASTDSSGDAVRRVADLQPHPDFQFTPEPGDSNLSDIGLVLLDSDAPAGYLPARMAEENPSLPGGSPVDFAGYGITEPVDRIMASAGTLHRAQAPFLSFDESRKELRLSDHGGGLSCLGDSGGPAFQITEGTLSLIGVVSHGTGQNCGGDQIFTSVAAHREFVEGTLRNWGFR